MTMSDYLRELLSNGRTATTTELAEVLKIDENSTNKQRTIRQRASRLGFDLVTLGRNAWTLK